MTEQLKRPPPQPFAPRRRLRRVSDNLTSELAVLVSILIHVAAFMTWQYRDVLRQFTLLKPLLPAPAARPVSPPTGTPTITFIETPAAPAPAPKERVPQRFVETDATQVAEAEPQDARFYSDRSTTAANPVNPTTQTGDTPYLDGQDTRIISTESVAAAPPGPPQPVRPPAPPPQPVAPPPVAPQPAEPPLKVAEEGIKIVEEKKVALLEKPAAPVLPSPPVPPAAPAPGATGSQREIASLKTRMTAAGVSRIGVAAFNVAGSPFGTYDKALIRAVQSRWYALIEQNGLYERAGQVTLRFNLLSDGSVQALAVKENTAGQILGLFCEKAVVDSAPFAPLSDELRRLIGEDSREVSFTFYY